MSQTISGMHTGPVHLDTDAVIAEDAMISGDLTLGPSIRVEVLGMVGGDLIVGPGSTAIVTGMVSGEVRLEGGTAEVKGMAGRR